MTDELPGVSRTAVWVAMMRAGEGARPDRWFDDQLASAFVAAAPPEPAGSVPPGASEFMAIRTRFYDEGLLAACAAGIRQVVVLAAGLDSRAFRLDWPFGLRLFELDLDALFRFKEAVLAEHGAVARCERITVAADLRADWATGLTAAGFDPAARTAWLVEGLLPYLTMADNDRLLATIGGLSAPGSHLAFDHMDSSAAERAVLRETSDTVRKMGTQFKSTLDDPVGWLAGHGWRATIARAPALGVSYGRPLPDFVDLVASNVTILSAAIR